jgi:transporter family protein
MAAGFLHRREDLAVSRFVGCCNGPLLALLLRALQIGDAARVAPIDKLSVVLVAVFAAVFLRERLSGSNSLGVLVIGKGAVLVTVRA